MEKMPDQNAMGRTPGICELPGCDNRGKKPAQGTYQVYDGSLPTMTRPAYMCRECIAFAEKCGLRVQAETIE